VTKQAGPKDDTDSVSVDFIDILFGLVVAQIFMEFVGVTRHEYATWANLVLALMIVVFSWIGYHVSKKHSPRPASFEFFPLTQLFVDVVIVAVYLAFAKEVQHTQKIAAEAHHILSIRPEAITIVVIFALYTLWDLEQVGLALTDETRKKDPTHADDARLHLVRGLMALFVFSAYSAIVVFAWHPGSNAAVIVADIVFVVLLYGYRVLQGFERDKRRGKKTALRTKLFEAVFWKVDSPSQ